MPHIKSSLECIQQAWAYRLRDFRQWCKPEGQAVFAWKTAPLKHAILACRSNMVDDAEAMLKAWAENQNDPNKQGSTAFIPVMTTAIAPIQPPPDFEQVVGRSSWITAVLPNDTQGRVVQVRAMPAAFRCQIAFFCPDTHGAMMVANQFCLYWKHEGKRTFNVPFEVGMDGDNVLTDLWEFRVLDNSLMPDTAMTDYKNLTIVTVDCTIVGSIPIVVGLGGEWDNYTDAGEFGTPPEWEAIPPGKDPNGVFKPIPGGGVSPSDLQKVVTEADTNNLSTGEKRHIVIDPATGVITETDTTDTP